MRQPVRQAGADRRHLVAMLALGRDELDDRGVTPDRRRLKCGATISVSSSDSVMPITEPEQGEGQGVAADNPIAAAAGWPRKRQPPDQPSLIARIS